MSAAAKILVIAQDYCNRDWQPIPIPFRKKTPVIKDWPNLRFDAEGAKDFFNGARSNIGVLLGEPSHGLVDIDLDCPEAISLAPLLLPATATFGRLSAPKSHWLYKCKPPGPRRVFANGSGMIVEYRATGGQTVFPGSAHEETGEVIRWDEDCNPAEIDSEKLQHKVAVLAASSVLLSHWVDGKRDDLATALTGVLLRGGWSPDKVDSYIHLISTQAGDTENRCKAKALDASLKSGRGHVPGFTKLKELIGESAEQIREWLGLKEEADWPVSLVTNASDLLTREVPEQEWLIVGLLLANSWAQFAGWRGIGKTMLVLTLALSIARGERFLFWDTPKAQRVLYVDGEMSLAQFKRTLSLISGNRDCGLLDLILSEDFHRTQDGPFRLNNEKHQLQFARLLADLDSLGRRPVVIIFDNLSSMISGLDENSNSEQDVILKLMIGLRHEGYTIIQIHHAGKGGDQRGASRREDALDLSIKLNPPEEKDEDGRAKFNFNFTKTRGMLEPKEKGFDAVLATDEHGCAVWTTDMKTVKERAKWLQVMKFIADKKPQSQTEIMTHFGLTKGTVSLHVSSLRKREFLGEGLAVTDSAVRYLAKAYPEEDLGDENEKY